MPHYVHPRHRISAEQRGIQRDKTSKESFGKNINVLSATPMYAKADEWRPVVAYIYGMRAYQEKEIFHVNARYYNLLLGPHDLSRESEYTSPLSIDQKYIKSIDLSLDKRSPYRLQQYISDPMSQSNYMDLEKELQRRRCNSTLCLVMIQGTQLNRMISRWPNTFETYVINKIPTKLHESL